MRVIFVGLVQVLLEDGTAATAGNWVRISAVQDGRADAQNSIPPGLLITEVTKTLGDCAETVAAGTDKLCWVLLR
jgi:hypothetical protein